MLLFRLALQIGATVGELLGRMTSVEFTYWQTVYGLQPWGDDRADLRSAFISCTLANAYRDEKKRPTPFDLLDFMPYSGDPPKPQTPAEQRQMAEMITEAMRIVRTER